MTTDQPFLAISYKNIYKLDPREKNRVVQSKVYSKANNFSAIKPNINGHFAIGSEMGEVRLYDSVGEVAKNLYAGFGDAISSLDSSTNGKWLLATCDHYLMVIPTFANGLDGFKKRLGKQKPVIRKLTILPKDLV